MRESSQGAPSTEGPNGYFRSDCWYTIEAASHEPEDKKIEVEGWQLGRNGGGAGRLHSLPSRGRRGYLGR